MDRHRTFLWIRDILEHVEACYDEWQHTEGPSEMRLADMIERDLDQCRRLCTSLRREAEMQEHCLEAAGV